MKHITIHEFLKSFMDAEEPLPVTTPQAASFDEAETQAIDIRSDPHMSLFDYVEEMGHIPVGSDTPTAIKDALPISEDDPPTPAVSAPAEG